MKNNHLILFFIQIENMKQVRSPRQRVKVGRAISEGEWAELRKSVREQETIILGYQKVREGERERERETRNT